jgi:hypothetical protein
MTDQRQQATDERQKAPDQHEGAVEGDRPTDSPQHGNENAPALNDQGLPSNDVKIAQDVIGANLDKTEGG